MYNPTPELIFLLFDPLKKLAPLYSLIIKPNSFLILSSLLNEQIPYIINWYNKYGKVSSLFCKSSHCKFKSTLQDLQKKEWVVSHRHNFQIFLINKIARLPGRMMISIDRGLQQLLIMRGSSVL